MLECITDKGQNCIELSFKPGYAPGVLREALGRSIAVFYRSHFLDLTIPVKVAEGQTLDAYVDFSAHPNFSVSPDPKRRFEWMEIYTKYAVVEHVIMDGYTNTQHIKGPKAGFIDLSYLGNDYKLFFHLTNLTSPQAFIFDERISATHAQAYLEYISSALHPRTTESVLYIVRVEAARLDNFGTDANPKKNAKLLHSVSRQLNAPFTFPYVLLQHDSLQDILKDEVKLLPLTGRIEQDAIMLIRRIECPDKELITPPITGLPNNRLRMLLYHDIPLRPLVELIKQASAGRREIVERTVQVV